MATRQRREEGQLTIFLGISLLIVLTTIAFVINVGLFVKAKINLQNAVDSAAWSGAAVQARQLSNISYLNWEMRNTYKEWMFKYYVLGQISLQRTNKANLDNPDRYFGQKDDNMNFRMVPFLRPGVSGYNGSNPAHTKLYEKLNAPSICINFAGTHNICEIYGIPGAPRFQTNNVIGISEQNEAFLNNIVQSKSTDCGNRSTLNFSVAMLWAYGTKENIFAGTPEIAAHRMGAWPQAMELALRIRNLEAVVNRSPVDQPICAAPVDGVPCTQVDSLELGSEIPVNERPIKAFWSAFRNLGTELKDTFTLKELRPNPLSESPQSLSNLLIPENKVAVGDYPATNKFYLDLMAVPVNFVNFFTHFAVGQGSYAGVTTEGQCTASKTAIPVPGYLFGFIKNQEVITYYAVKGEANYMGLLFPFKSDGIKLKAYAAAKPFGGRIGPKLFDIRNNQTVAPRGRIDSGVQKKSAHYISGFDVPTSVYEPGMPIPMTSNFWVSTADMNAVGGFPGASDIKFGVPNLLLDLPNSSSDPLAHIQTLKAAANRSISETATENLGLYIKDQYKALLNNLVSENLTAQVIDDSIAKVRAPTRYESLNYLIPTIGNESENIDSIDVVTNYSGNDSKIRYRLFAPVVGAYTLYENAEIVKNMIYQYLQSNSPAVTEFLTALKDAADSMKTSAAATEMGAASYDEAAKSLWNDPSSGECESVAGRFNTFFTSIAAPSPTTCGIKPLSLALSEYISNESGANPSFRNYYLSSYTKPAGGNLGIMNAYMPGPRQGADMDGTTPHAFGLNTPQISKRNFYSTKLIQTEKVVNGTGSPTSKYNLSGVLIEKGALEAAAATPNFVNILDYSELSEFGELTH